MASHMVKLNDLVYMRTENLALDIDMKMNGSKQHAALALLFLVLSVAGYTSGSVLSSSSMLAAQQGQENVTQDNVVQVQQECDVEGAYSTEDYCNFCYCLNGHLSCSKKICFTKSEPLEVEKDNSTIVYEEPLETDNKSQQNPAKANEDNPVDPEYEDLDYEEDPDYKECVEGTRWREECNICICSSGQPICTMHTCLDSRECVDGSYWVDDCNTCECYNGEATCTDNKCLSDSAPHCVEGSSWTEDCNTCFCSNGITSCSKKICPAEGDVTELTEIIPAQERNTSSVNMAGNNVMGGAEFRGQSLTSTIKITMLSEVDFCKFMINGQEEHFPFIEKCYKAGKLACAYCENEALPTYNPRTCKCHKKSRFTGRK